MTTGDASAARRHEDEERERYRELLEELRTVIPGVQVLFGFLLTVPFSSRFTELDDLGIQVFTLAYVAVGSAAVVLLTPTAYHRLRPRHVRKQRIRLGVRVTIVGMALLAVGIGASIFVVVRLVFQTESVPPAETFSPTTIGGVVAGVIGGTAVALWFALPIVQRRLRPEDEDAPPEGRSDDQSVSSS